MVLDGIVESGERQEGGDDNGLEGQEDGPESLVPEAEEAGGAGDGGGDVDEEGVKEMVGAGGGVDEVVGEEEQKIVLEGEGHSGEADADAVEVGEHAGEHHVAPDEE